jgi:hypothetical protein
VAVVTQVRILVTADVILFLQIFKKNFEIKIVDM